MRNTLEIGKGIIVKYVGIGEEYALKCEVQQGEMSMLVYADAQNTKYAENDYVENILENDTLETYYSNSGTNVVDFLRDRGMTEDLYQKVVSFIKEQYEKDNTQR